MEESKTNNCVLVFLRSPEKGKVKTRLSRVLDEDIVLHLYQCFAEDVIETATNSRYPLRICFHPPGGMKKIVEWLGSGFEFQPQKGEDLGERMAHAFEASFSSGHQHVILMGTDIPDLDAGIIQEAFGSLHEHHTVIGPAMDGGYYLIGFRYDAYSRKFFEGMTWGERDVFEKTVSCMNHEGLRIYTLPVWRDIDTYDDLLEFAEKCSKKPAAAPRTRHYLDGINLSRTPRTRV